MMTKNDFLLLSEKDRFDWMITHGYYADESGQVFSPHKRPIGSFIKSLNYIIIGIRLPHSDRKNTVTFRAHRFIFYYFNKSIPICVDHIDRNTMNNSRFNLRSSNIQENSFNTAAKGCSYNRKQKKWHARIRIDGKLISLGYFEDYSDAHQAYLTGKQKYHQYANT